MESMYIMPFSIINFEFELKSAPSIRYAQAWKEKFKLSPKWHVKVWEFPLKSALNSDLQGA